MGSQDVTFFDNDLQEIDHYLQEFDKIQQSTSKTSKTSATSKTIKIALSRLEEEFRYILVAYTTSSSDPAEINDSCSTSDPTEINDSCSDSSFSSSPSHFRFSISSNVSENENSDSDAPTQELVDHRGNSCRKLSFPSIINISKLALLPIESEAIYYLRCIAERMIASGSTQECVQAYYSIRKPAMNASFLKLGTETLSTQEARTVGWESLEKKIKRWIEAARVCFQVLFANEKMLLDQIFEGLSLDIGANCFMETVEGPAMQLFSFAQVVTTVSRRSLERLFGVLDLYNALSDLLPAVEIIFEGKWLESIGVQAVETLSKLAEVVREILEEFENALLHEISKIPVPNGSIHPLTRYVMDYMKVIASYKQPLIEIVVSNPPALESKSISGDGSMEFVEVEGMSRLGLHMNWIIYTLQLKLEEKSKNYDNPSLGHLFMMNNLHYMFKKMKGCPELGETIEDDDCLKKLTGKFMMAASNYVTSTWVRVLYCLRDEGLHTSGSSGVFKSALRKRFKTFNAMFEEVHKTQAEWLVPDIQLREELGISISVKLIPAYRSFVGRFSFLIGSWRSPENYIKYSVEDLESAVLDLFEGVCPKRLIKK